jgi:signal transduction histidine kinase/ActR/RegA family two-component response regulator
VSHDERVGSFLTEPATPITGAGAQRAWLYDLFAQAPAAICVLRGNALTFEMANPLYRRVVGRHDLLGRPLMEALPELRGQGFDELLRGVMATGVPYVAQEALVKLDRRGNGALEEAYFSFSYTPLRDSAGAVDQVLVFCHEVTDQVRARQEVEAARFAAEAANRSKDEFIAVLGHELRNPLSTIHNAAAALDRLVGPPPLVAELHTLIARTADHLSRLVGDLLDLSRVNAGKIMLRRQPLDLAHAISRALAAMHGAGRCSAHRIALDLESVIVDADPTRVEQIVGNLLDNALKYTPEGGRVELSCAREGDTAVLSVRDNGIGIAREHLDRLFQPFVQLREAQERAQGGLGLGLALVGRLVALHGGRALAESAGPGRGSLFIVRLPAVEPEPEPEAAPAPAPAPSAASASGRRVLIVDDDAGVRAGLRSLLRALGHQVDEAASAERGLVAIFELRPDVALVDIRMPGMDGYSFARQVRQSPGGAELFVVALTGYGQPEDSEQALEAGFDLHLVKPVSERALREVLANGRPGRAR